MAAAAVGGGDGSGPLTARDIVRLAAAISADRMELIAEGYLGLDDERMKNIKRDASSSEAFNRDVLKNWANRNSGPNQKQVSLLLCFIFDQCNGIIIF